MNTFLEALGISYIILLPPSVFPVNLEVTKP